MGLIMWKDAIEDLEYEKNSMPVEKMDSEMHHVCTFSMSFFLSHY